MSLQGECGGVDGYEMEGDVVLLRVGPEGFTTMAEIVRATSQDAAFARPMRRLIDLRAPQLGFNCQGMRLQAQSLANMGTILAPRWAVLTSDRASAHSAARMFAILAGIEDMDVQVFDEKPEALWWLRQWRL
jgi:hypothetical protein